MSSKLVRYKTGLPMLPQRSAPEVRPRRSERHDEKETGFDLPGAYGFLAQTLARRRWWILGSAVIVVAVSLLQVLTMTPVYRTSTTIEIQPDLGRTLPYKELSEAAEDFITTETYVQTQKEVLRSRVLAQRVVDRLELGGNAEFNLERRRGVLVDLPKALLRRTLELFGSKADEPVVRDFDAADQIVDDLDVRVMVNTRLVEIGYSSHSPLLSATILNTLVEELIELERAERLAAAARSREFLQLQLVELRATVDRSESALKEYASKRKILSIDGRQQFALDKLVDLQQEATRLDTQVIVDRAQYQELESASVTEFPDSLKNDTILQLQQRLSTLNEQLASFAARFGEEWPEGKAIRRQIDEIGEQLAAEKQRALTAAAQRYEASREQAEMFRVQLAEHKQRANELDQDLVEYTALEQAAEADRELYDSLFRRVKELGIVAGLKSSNVRILDRAAVPDEIDYPSKPQTAIVALLLGLGLGLAGAVLVESVDHTVRVAEDIEQALDLPCLGVIPALDPARVESDLPDGTLPRSAALQNLVELQKSGGWEAYRALRTTIVYANEEPFPRTIMVTSALASEGRTFTVVNLGVALAQIGARVLLVDLDLRSPGVASMLGLDEGTLGISSFLSRTSQRGILSHVRDTALPSLSVISAGAIPRNPPELIGSDRMVGALETLREGFDVVLIDTPPLLGCTDAVVVSLMVDQVLMVTRSARTPRRALELAGEQLAPVRTKLLGCVINGADMRGAEHAYRPGGSRSPERGRGRRATA